MAALRYTFSRPVNSGWKPAPISISEPTRPPTASVPVVGAKIPAISFSRVDLPEPLRPTMPNASPGATRKSTSVRAQSSRVCGSRRRRIASFSERVGVSVILNRRPTPRPTISPGATAAAFSELDCKAVLEPLHDPEADECQRGADHEDVDEQRGSGDGRLQKRRPEALHVRSDWVAVPEQLDQPVMFPGRGQLLEAVQDRSQEEPRQEQHREQMLDVAEEDVHDREQPGEAERQADQRAEDGDREHHRLRGL